MAGWLGSVLVVGAGVEAVGEVDELAAVEGAEESGGGAGESGASDMFDSRSRFVQ